MRGIYIKIQRCYTRVCRRQAAVNLPKLPTLSESIHIGMDEKSKLIVTTLLTENKSSLGDQLSSRKLGNQQVEALLRCYALNKMTLLGMPVSKQI